MAGFAYANQSQTNSTVALAGWPPRSRGPLGPGLGGGAAPPKAAPGTDTTIIKSTATPALSPKSRRGTVLARAALGDSWPANGVVDEKLGRLAGGPDPSHEVGFRGDGAEAYFL